MSDQTKIEWSDASWNPIRGCSRVSEGCRNCYAEVMAARFSKPGQWGAGLAKIIRQPDGSADHRWTGKVHLVPDMLPLPLRWRKPRRIFVNSTSDLFHESVPDAWIDLVFAVMALCPQHTFQVLTKRAARMRAYFARLHDDPWALSTARMIGASRTVGFEGDFHVHLPPQNVWLGVSVEDQDHANERIPDLLATPAAVRFISAEPLLGPMDLTALVVPMRPGVWEFDALRVDVDPIDDAPFYGACLDWVIAGGESGAHARPANPQWFRDLRDQCAAAGVPFFFKQWGEWVSVSEVEGDGPHFKFPDGRTVRRVGKARAGRTLDHRMHDVMPA